MSLLLYYLRLHCVTWHQTTQSLPLPTVWPLYFWRLRKVIKSLGNQLFSSIILSTKVKNVGVSKSLVINHRSRQRKCCYVTVINTTGFQSLQYIFKIELTIFAGENRLTIKYYTSNHRAYLCYNIHCFLSEISLLLPFSWHLTYCLQYFWSIMLP